MLRHAPRAALALGVLFADVGSARADDATSVAAATVLFDEGVKLLDSRRPAEACPKLARSQALAPSGGTLLVLAECYEKLGKTATAWLTFREVAARAASAGKHDAEASALAKAKALEARMPRLTITVPQSSHVPGLEVRRDGDIVKEAELGVPVPIDPGTHEVRATAPQLKPWVKSVVMRDGMQESLMVPALSAEGTDPRAAGEAPTTDPPPDTTSNGKTQRVVGITIAGVGLATFLVGGAFGVLAKSKNDQALDNHCPMPTKCTQEGLDLTEDARSHALISTILVAIGATGLVVGSIVFFAAPSGGAASQARTVRISPRWTTGSAGGTAAVTW